MGQESAVTTHAGIAAVKHGRLRQVVLIREPIPVWLVSLVAAFCPQCLFVRPHEVSVPAQEVALWDTVRYFA